MKINVNFKLNQMQQKAVELEGQNIVLNAPTGSGKTEAILCNMKNGETYYFLLPMVTSCIFMYKRLRLLNLNVEIRTSVLTESSPAGHDSEHTGKIIIVTPDPLMIEFLQTKEVDNKNLVLDELDNYPLMVQSALIEYMRVNTDSHIIVASATLNKSLENALNSICKEIKFQWSEDFLSHRIRAIEFEDDDRVFYNDIVFPTLSQGKKLGVIMNSIELMDIVRDRVTRMAKRAYGTDVRVIVLHGRLDHHERIDVESRLFSGDYDVVISNDIISMSVDIDFDTLVTEPTDKLNVMLQRLGRCNRTNKNIGDRTNVFILEDLDVPKFMDYELRRGTLELFRDRDLWYSDIKEIRESIPSVNLPTLEDIYQYWRELETEDLSPSLRDVPWEFRYYFETYDKNGKKIRTYTPFKINRNRSFPFDRYPCDEAGEYVYVRLFRDTYIITGKEGDAYVIEYVPYYTTRYVECPNCGSLVTREHYYEGSEICDYCPEPTYSWGMEAKDDDTVDEEGFRISTHYDGSCSRRKNFTPKSSNRTDISIKGLMLTNEGEYRNLCSKTEYLLRSEPYEQSMICHHTISMEMYTSLIVSVIQHYNILMPEFNNVVVKCSGVEPFRSAWIRIEQKLDARIHPITNGTDITNVISDFIHARFLEAVKDEDILSVLRNIIEYAFAYSEENFSDAKIDSMKNLFEEILADEPQYRKLWKNIIILFKRRFLHVNHIEYVETEIYGNQDMFTLEEAMCMEKMYNTSIVDDAVEELTYIK